MKYLLLFSLQILFFSHVNAQTFNLTGKVVDAIEKKGLYGSSILLKNGQNKSVKGAITNRDGNFTLKDIAIGDYRLEISYVGFQPFSKTIAIKTSSIDLGTIEMLEDAVKLDEVEVTENVLPTLQKGDTTQYNAAAFKVNPDANAQDLIEKMPGVVVQEGTVQAQGENVTEVLVDGRPFFGSDPSAALKNIPATIIDKIEVFDKQSEQAEFSGFDTGETTKTINIVTKVNMRNGQFGHLYAGYGSDDRYRGGGNINFFNDDQRLTLLAQSNNINEQNFSSEDLLGVVASSSSGKGRRGGKGGGRGRGGNRGGKGSASSNVNDFLVGSQSGISQTHAIGLNYSDEWGKKIEVSGSYFFNQTDNAANDLLQRFYVDNPDSDEIYEEQSQTTSINNNHRFNFRLNYKFNRRSSLLIRPVFSYQGNDGIEEVLGQYTVDDRPLNTTDYQLNAQLSAVQFSNSILFRHRFEKRGRSFSIDFRNGYDPTSGDRFLYAETIDSRPATNTLTDQFSEIESKNNTYSSRINYSEPLGSKSQLQFNYRINYQTEESDQQTADFSELTNAYSDANTPLSNTFNKDYLAHDFGIGWRYRNKGFSLMPNLSYQRAKLDNEQLFPIEAMSGQTFNALLPRLVARYRFEDRSNLRFVYRTSTQAPSVTQLQEVIDNTDPFELTIGNPALVQKYQHDLFIRYSRTNTEKSTTFFALLGGSAAKDYIANSTLIAQQDSMLSGGVILQEGAQLIAPVNLKGYYKLRSFLTYGIPLKPLKSNLNINLSADYTRTPGLVDLLLNYSNTTTIGLGLTLGSNISEKVDFTISSQSNINQTRNSTIPLLDNDYLSQTNKLRVNWIFGKNIVLRTSLQHQLYAGYSDEFNQNFLLWSMSIGKKFFKNKQGEINFSVFDILGQNASLVRNVTEAYIEDVQTKVLRRYVMLKFRYTIRRFKERK